MVLVEYFTMVFLYIKDFGNIIAIMESELILLKMEKVKKVKATPGLPMWSPTIVLTGLDRA